MRWVAPLAAAAFVMVAGVLIMALEFTPMAQCDAGCLAQKIFYFHVPSAYAMYIGVGACVVGSVGYLARRSAGWDALAQAGGEVAVAFSAILLTTGPLWGRKAWGTYWVWDPRLTTTLLASMIFVAYLVLRSSAGGEAEKRFSSALAIMGAAVIPIIHYSVQLWRGQHPTVISRGGGGLDAAMVPTLVTSFVAFTLLATALIALRTYMGLNESRLEALRTDAVASDISGESS
jgi:heme exporter protein C